MVLYVGDSFNLVKECWILSPPGCVASEPASSPGLVAHSQDAVTPPKHGMNWCVAYFWDSLRWLASLSKCTKLSVFKINIQWKRRIRWWAVSELKHESYTSKTRSNLEHLVQGFLPKRAEEITDINVITSSGVVNLDLNNDLFLWNGRDMCLRIYEYNRLL